MEVWVAGPPGLSEILYEVCLRTMCLKKREGEAFTPWLRFHPLPHQGLAPRVSQLGGC